MNQFNFNYSFGISDKIKTASCTRFHFIFRACFVIEMTVLWRHRHAVCVYSSFIISHCIIINQKKNKTKRIIIFIAIYSEIRIAVKLTRVVLPSIMLYASLRWRVCWRIGSAGDEGAFLPFKRHSISNIIYSIVNGHVYCLYYIFRICSKWNESVYYALCYCRNMSIE